MVIIPGKITTVLYIEIGIIIEQKYTFINYAKEKKCG